MLRVYMPRQSRNSQCATAHAGARTPPVLIFAVLHIDTLESSISNSPSGSREKAEASSWCMLQPRPPTSLSTSKVLAE